MAEITRNSFLNFCDLLDSDGTEFWETAEFPEILPQDGDRFLEIDDRYAGRLDLVAFDEYGDSDLWWVIALANKIDLVPTGVVIGLKVRIPEKSYVDSLISRAES